MLLDGWIDLDATIWQAKSGALATRNLTLPGGWYRLTPLLTQLQTLARVYAEFDPELSLGLNNGFVRFVNTGASAIVVTFPATAAALKLRSILGFTSNVTVPAGGSVTAEYLPSIRIPLARLAVEDIESQEAKAEKAEGIDTTHTSLYSIGSYHDLSFRFFGSPRSPDAELEQYGMRRFFVDVLAPGSVFRYYPDEAVSTTERDYSDPAADPWGYVLLQHIAPLEYKPSSMVSGWYQHWRFGIRCRRALEEPT